MPEYIVLTKEQAVNVLAEIGELRRQVSDVTSNRDFHFERVKSVTRELQELRTEYEKISRTLDSVEQVCKNFDAAAVCDDCHPNLGSCDGCDAALCHLKCKIIDTIRPEAAE